MTQETVVETPETELSDETILWTNIRNNMGKFPQSLSIVRNEITEEFVPTVYGRGDKKEAGLLYVGLKNKTTVDNLENRIKYIGVDKVCTLIQNFLTANAIASSERAVGEDSTNEEGEPNGQYNEELLIKGLQEFSSAGETIKELEEGLKAAQKDMADWQKEYMSNPALMQPGHPKNLEFAGRLQAIVDQMGYCTSNIERRRRPGAGPRGPRKNKVAVPA